MRILLFILLLYSSFWGLERLFQKGVAGNGHLKISYLSQKTIDAEVLIMGTCVAANGVHIDSFANHIGMRAYSLGVDHSIIDEHIGLLHIYLKNNPKPPKYIFYLLYPESFDARLNKFHAYYFTNYYTDTLIHRLLERNDPKYVWYSDKLPFIKFAYYNAFTLPYMFQGWRYLLSHRTIDFWKTGYTNGVSEVLGQKIDNTLLHTFGDYRQLKNVVFRYDSSQIASFKNLVQYAKHKNIQLIGISSPYWNDLEKYSSNVKDTYIFMEKMCREQGVPYLRLNDTMISQDSSYFWGVFKLNQRGSLAYTKVFSEAAKQLIQK